MADAFRASTQSGMGLNPINEAQELANKHLDTITDIKTRADTIAKTMGKMKIFTGSKAIGEKVTKVYAKEIADAKNVVTQPIKDFTGKIGDAVSKEIISPIKGALSSARDAMDATWNSNAASQTAARVASRAGVQAENGVAGAGQSVATTAEEQAAVAAAKVGSGVTPDADALASSAVARVAGVAGKNVATKEVETIVAKKTAGAVGKAAAEEGGGQATGGILDAIPGGEAIGVIVGAITAGIAAHKAHKAMRADANQPSAVNVVNSSFQSGIGTDM